jgi:hypothetical protein
MKVYVRNIKQAMIGVLTAIVLFSTLGVAQAAHAGGEPPIVVDYGQSGHMLLGSVGAAGSATADAAGTAVLARITDPQWIVVNARQPSTLLAGTGTTIFRSTNSGSTWTDVASGLLTPSGSCVASLGEPSITSDGQQLLGTYERSCGTPGSGVVGAAFSLDGGSHWQVSGDDGTYYGGTSEPAASPVSPKRVYALYVESADDTSTGYSLRISDDGGRTWTATRAIPTNVLPGQEYGNYPVLVVGDPVQRDTVYVDVEPIDPQAHHGFVYAVRSDDAGLTWTKVTAPAASPALKTFGVTTDPLLPGTLVGQTADQGLDADVRYYSTDSGRTWTAGTCPGDLHGICPPLRVGGVFGAGSLYALGKDGIYAFEGSGKAGRRLPISDRLPVPISSLTAVQAGLSPADPTQFPGEPVYLLAQGQLYRSGDAGLTWKPLTVILGPLPNQLPPSAAPGTRFVSATHHSVGVPFVSTYARLGLDLIGFPITEAYTVNGALYQDFQRLRLRLGHGGSVVEDPLGEETLAYHTRQQAPTAAAYIAAAKSAAPVPDTATQRYFPSTHHTLSGALLRFWQKQGGLAVFGAPISEVFLAKNGDRTGHVYQTQYFEFARLEVHPETTNPRYAVQLGLLGNDALFIRGWSTHP